MSYYFAAASDDEACAAHLLPGGPAPGNPRFAAIHERDVLAAPHFEQLIALAGGVSSVSIVAELVVLDRDPHAPSVQRLPDRMRDALAGLVVDEALTRRWSEEVWGLEPGDARLFADGLVALASGARQRGEHLYWWIEL